MIIQGLLDLIYNLLTSLFGWISLPALPKEINDVLDKFLECILGAVDFAALLFNFDLLKILIPVVLVIIYLDKVWKLVMFILKKIPFIDIH